jgi:hypothetical protein
MKKSTKFLLVLGALAGTLIATNLAEAGRGGGGGGARSTGRSAPSRYTPPATRQYNPVSQTHMSPLPGNATPAKTGDKTTPKSNDKPGNPKDKDSHKKSKKDKHKHKSCGGDGDGGCGGGDGDGDGGFVGGDPGVATGVEEGPPEEEVVPTPVPATETTAATPAEVSPASRETDLELIEVRCVDAGTPAKNQGPCFRVWFRNNSLTVVGTSFRVAVLASLSRNFDLRSPRAVVEVKAMKPGEVLTVDLRLPMQVNFLGRNIEGRSLPFGFLAAVVDCEQTLSDSNRENNIAVLGRLEIPMVEE